jgi:hypothetical protein
LIENNRVVAHHIGLEGSLSDNVDYILKTTYSNNHGRYLEEQRAENNSEEYKFEPSLKQLSLFIKLIKQSQKWEHLQFSAAIASDIGELYKNSFAIQIGVKRQL